MLMITSGWMHRLEQLRREFPADRIHYQNGPPRAEPVSVDERREAWPRRSSCTAGRQTLTVCANGRVVACEQMPEREEDYLGDLRTQSLRDVWVGEAMDRYLIHPPREKFRGTVCHDCDEFVDCQEVRGACVRDVVNAFGSRWNPGGACPRAPVRSRER